MNLRIVNKAMLTVGLWAMAVPVWAGSQIEKTLPLNPGGQFILESDAGSVSLTGVDESGAKVVITSSRDDLQDLVDFSFDDSPGLVRVRARRHNSWSWFENLDLHYDVRVPRATAVEIKTGGGAIEISSLTRDAELKTSGGSIRARQIQGHTELSTSGGPIEAESIDGTLIARTSGGPIHVERVTGRVDAHTSGGGVTVIFSKNNGHGGVIESSGGSITVAVDPSANLQIDAATSGGSIHSDLPIRVSGTISSRALRGTLGSGGNMLTVHTSGGSIHLASL